MINCWLFISLELSQQRRLLSKKKKEQISARKEMALEIFNP